MSAIAVHHTPTTDRPWDGPAATAAAPASRAVLRYMHAWVDPTGDPDTKAAYALPHHGPRSGAPAVLPGVRNALARLPQSRIPAADRPAVESHLRAHLEDAE
jgi:hypothetical protein